MKSVYYSVLHIYRNQWISTFKGVFLYAVWQFVRRFSKYPLRISIEKGIQIEFANSTLALEGGTKLYTQGLYDGNNMRLVKRYYQLHDALFWDVGSNIGLYSLVASKNNKSRVVAFEPHPFTFQLLNRQIEINARKNIQAVNLGLSEMDGDVHFSNVDGSSTNSIVTDSNDSSSTIIVPVVQADHFVQGEVPHIVKIDVEGFEREVLLGFQKRMKEVKLMIVEVSRNDQEVSAIFEKQGFLGPFEIDLKNLELLPYRKGVSLEDPVWIHQSSLREMTELIQHYEE
jgi:FkbM family methyltransferase